MIMGRSRKTPDPGHATHPIYHEISLRNTHFGIPS
jgi:hypothetical protein